MLRQPFLASLILGLGLALGGCASEVGNDGAKVGGSCVVSGECHIDSRCLTGVSWPEGYCVASCDSDEECPDGSRCVEEEGGICVVECVGAADCRSEANGDGEGGGYACAELESRGGPGNVMGCVVAAE